MDPSGLPEDGTPADSVVPSVGPDADSALFKFGRITAPLIILGLSLFMVWLKKSVQIVCQNEKAEDTEFFECETIDQYLEENKNDLKLVKELKG